MDHLHNFFENLAQHWDGSQPATRNQFIEGLLALFNEMLQPCESILDVGTGTGALIPILRERYPASRITSIDLAIHMLLRAQQKTPDAALIQADVHALPFRDGYFACAICHNSFPHFWQKTKALVEIRRVLDVGGKLLILHDISREKVNSIHRNTHARIIHHDLLPEGKVLGQMLIQSGFQLLSLEDVETHYFSFAQKQ